MKFLFVIVPLLILIFLSGCTGNNGYEDGLFVTMQADPPTAFSDHDVTVYVDIENRGERPINDVTIHIFDVGIMKPTEIVSADRLRSILQGVGEDLLNTVFRRIFGYYPAPLEEEIECVPGIYRTMLSDELKSYECKLKTPASSELIEKETTTTVSAKVTYTQNLSFSQLIEMVSEQYYQQHRNDFVSKPNSYTYRDKNVEVLVEFSDNIPMVVREGRDAYMYFTIKNIGNGFIDKIEDGDIIIQIPPQLRQTYNFDVIQCSSYGGMEIIGKEFPRVACKLDLPPTVNLITNYDFIFTLVYDYEVRVSTDITIVK
jgi:hypothetical protein